MTYQLVAKGRGGVLNLAGRLVSPHLSSATIGASIINLPRLFWGFLVIMKVYRAPTPYSNC